MYKIYEKDWQKNFDYIVIDLFSLALAFLMTFLLIDKLKLNLNVESYFVLYILFVLSDILFLILFDTFKDLKQRGYYVELAETLKHIIRLNLFIISILFFSNQSLKFDKSFIVINFAVYLVISYFSRILWKNKLRNKLLAPTVTSVIILTTEKNAKKMINILKSKIYPEKKITGIAIIDKDLRGENIRNIPVIANKNTVVNYLVREWVDEVYTDMSIHNNDTILINNQLIKSGITNHVVIENNYVFPERVQSIKKYKDKIIITNSMTAATTKQFLIKRIIDILGGIVGSLIAIILYVVIAPIIYIQSPGPILFKQTRIGLNGKPFTLYKFRSMDLNAEERKKDLQKGNKVSDGMMFSVDYDDRIIGAQIHEDGTIQKGIGNFIRDYSIDEFPQFFNVIKGEMSLVGTRPPTVDEWEKYEIHHRARLSTKPGITGMWQTSGRNKIIDFEEVVLLDTYYINEWSIGLDIKLILKTILSVIKKDGAQ